MSDDQPMNNWNLWGPELEEALTSLCWNQPEPYLAETLREIDPETHFVQWHCRHILEAVRLCYCELGATDWHTIVVCLAEMGLLKEVGDKQRLDEIYRNPGYGSLHAWYIATLKAIAEQRSTDPTMPLYFFTGGGAESFLAAVRVVTVIRPILVRFEFVVSDTGSLVGVTARAFPSSLRHNLRGRDNKWRAIRHIPFKN
jgi:hypothetical protein